MEVLVRLIELSHIEREERHDFQREIRISGGLLPIITFIGSHDAQLIIHATTCFQALAANGTLQPSINPFRT